MHETLSPKKEKKERVLVINSCHRRHAMESGLPAREPRGCFDVLMSSLTLFTCHHLTVLSLS